MSLPSHKPASPRKREANIRSGIVFNLALVLLSTVLGFWVLSGIKQVQLRTLADSLNTNLQTSLQTLHYWNTRHIFVLQNVTSDPTFLELTQRQLEAHTNSQPLNNETLAKLRDIYFQRLHRKNFPPGGFFIIAPDNTSIASMRDENLGTQNLIKAHYPDLFERAFQGEHLLIPPIPSDIPFEGTRNIQGLEVPPTMFFLSPIKDAEGNVIAALTRRLNPEGVLSQLTNQAQIGETGETYLFDKNGRLLTNSRFESQLNEAGILDPQYQSILSIKLLNPGRNLLKQPGKLLDPESLELTEMAKSALAGNSGSNLEGYYDYRGVKVVGSWIWAEGRSIGIAAEIDIEEALEPYRLARSIIIFALGTTTLASVLFTIFRIRSSERTRQTLESINEKLEVRIEERTRDLTRREKQFRSLVSNIPGTVYRCRWDEHWTMLYVSDEVEKLTGYPPSDFLNNSVRSFASIIHPADLLTMEKTVTTSIAQKGRYALEYRIIRKDKTIRWVFERGSLASNEDSDTPEVDGLILDFTDRKEAEKEITKAKEEAESAKEEAINANKTKSVFLANMSHEIRTPMNAILGYSQLMQRDYQLTDNQRDSLDTINRSGEHLLTLINDILEMSKIEAGKVTLKPAPFYLPALLEDILSMLNA
ncbi:histidine kinase dimerization/phospho-acceptor domain-containing protein, partial [Pelagicoccus mobilis]